MVPKEHLSRIQGLNQMLMGAMNIGSAPMGALLLGLLPMQGVLAVDVLTALVGMLPLFFIAVPQPDTTKNSQPGAPSSTVWEDVRGGLRYVWAWPGLMLVGVLATLINLVLAPTNALQPLLVSDHFKGGAFHLAWMESAWGIGVVAGGLTLSAWGGFRRRVITSLVGILAVGLGIALIGVLPASAFSMAIVLMFLTGFCNPLINGPLFAVLQSVVAPEMQGRVFMLIVSMASAMSPLGLIVAGPLADQFGVRVWYVLGGLITTFMGAAAFLAPPIMNIEDGRREQTTANGAALQLAPAPVEANSD
jgi:DHA3 family macrolide efflux protein-like MFS transporter